MSDYVRLRTPFLNLSFTPDVPSNALGPNEYNSGLNVEADVRGIKKVSGEQTILSAVPGNTIFMDGNFRTQATWVYIVATREGKWYQVTASGITNITPGFGANPAAALSGYNDDLNITTSWVGGVFFINDTLRPPMYYRPTDTEIQIYDSAPDSYVWNYGTSVVATRAGFVRNFCSPNVGNILIAGNITEDLDTSITVNYPTTVRWSQAFANTGVPATWEPTLTNIANEQEVPVRGPLIDGFFLGGNFYVCSYWDTVVFSPIAYQSSTAPIFGVRLFNQGRGLLNNNCWANTDQNVYGIDSRDIWVFDGSNFNSLGNQKVRNYFFANLNLTYSDRLFMVNNTQKYQIEIYYPDLNSTGWCNKMISYRYDLDCWQPPRDIGVASHAVEAPIYQNSVFNDATRTVTYTQAIANSQLVQKDQGTTFLGSPISSTFQRDNVLLGLKYSQQALMHRVLPEVYNIDTSGVPIANGQGTITVTIGGSDSMGNASVFTAPGTININTANPWIQANQNAYRTYSVIMSDTSSTNTWQAGAISWQFTATEDDR